MSPVSPVFHTVESVRLSFHSNSEQTSGPAFKKDKFVIISLFFNINSGQ